MFTKPQNGPGMMRCTSKHGREIYMFVTEEAALVERWQEVSGVAQYRDITMANLELLGIAMEVKVVSVATLDV